MSFYCWNQFSKVDYSHIERKILRRKNENDNMKFNYNIQLQHFCDEWHKSQMDKPLLKIILSKFSKFKLDQYELA